MQTPNRPTVALAADYIESHGAETGCPERTLWLAVLVRAGEDLFSSNEQIRQDAVSFFQGPDLLQVLDLAGISRAHAPWLRTGWSIGRALSTPGQKLTA